MFALLLFVAFAGFLASLFCFLSACYTYIKYTRIIKKTEKEQAKKRAASDRFWKSIKIECISYDEN